MLEDLDMSGDLEVMVVVAKGKRSGGFIKNETRDHDLDPRQWQRAPHQTSSPYIS